MRFEIKTKRHPAFMAVQHLGRDLGKITNLNEDDGDYNSLILEIKEDIFEKAQKNDGNFYAHRWNEVQQWADEVNLI